MSTRLVNVVIDAADLEALARFWAAALDGTFVEEFLREGEGVVRAPSFPDIDVVTVASSAPKRAKNRIHFDLGCTTEADRAQLLEALLDLGASRVDIGQGDVAWEVLADPEGNEFCLTEPSPFATGRMAAISFDAADAARQLRFWQAATGWSVEAEGDWGGALRDGSGRGPALVFGPPAAPKQGKNRVHLDVAPPPDGAIDAEVRRLVGLGATELDIGQGDVPWAVLADPEGNEFCVLTPR